MKSYIFILFLLFLLLKPNILHAQTVKPYFKCSSKKPNGQKVKALWCKNGFTYLATDSKSYNYYDYMGNLITTTDGKMKITSGVIYTVEK